MLSCLYPQARTLHSALHSAQEQLLQTHMSGADISDADVTEIIRAWATRTQQIDHNLCVYERMELGLQPPILLLLVHNSQAIIPAKQGLITQFLIDPNSPLCEILQRYGVDQGVIPGRHRMKFTMRTCISEISKGTFPTQQIAPTQTPNQLGMEDGDKIEVEFQEHY